MFQMRLCTDSRILTLAIRFFVCFLLGLKSTYFPQVVLAQVSNLSSQATPFVTPTPRGYPVTIKVDGQVLSVTSSTAEQALRLKQWERNNQLATWGLVIVILLVFVGWRELRHRRKQVEKNRERLFSKEPDEVIAAVQGLAGRPQEAYRLVLRWAQEFRKNKKIFERDVELETPEQRIIQEIQNALDSMVDRKTWLMQWVPLHPSFPRYLKIPQFQQIQGARLEGKTLTIDVGPIQLKGAYMINGNFHKIGLQNAKLWDTNLKKANLSFAHLQEVIFSEANLSEANLTQSHLQGADLESANLENADLSGAHLEMACLNDARMDRANFHKAFLKKTLLSGASLKEAIFRGAHLEDSDLTEAHLEGADFQHASLDGVYFLRSNLAGTKLLDVNLEWAILEEADYLSYAHRQYAKLSIEQEELYQQWEEAHPDAPWLQKEWHFWWQSPQPEQPKKRLDEIRVVQSYIYKTRTKK